MSCHFFTFKNTTRSGSLTNGTWSPVSIRLAVSFWPAGKTPSFNYSCKSLTESYTGYFNQIAELKNGDSHFVSDFDFLLFIINFYFLNKPWSIADIFNIGIFGFFKFLFSAKTQLNTAVLDCQNDIGLCHDICNRNSPAMLIKLSCHSFF